MSENSDKMKAMIKEAEGFQRIIEKMELSEINQIRVARGLGKLQGFKPEQLHDLYYVRKVLETDPWYDRAISNRNGRVARATMYGIAALVERDEQAS